MLNKLCGGDKSLLSLFHLKNSVSVYNMPLFSVSHIDEPPGANRVAQRLLSLLDL